MGLFDKVKQQQNDIQESEDRVGGSFKPLSSGIYKAKIKQMYAKPAKSGALGVIVEFEVFPVTGNPRKFTETHYVLNKNGENFYIDKNNQKQYLMGFNIINDLCLTTVQKTLFELEDEGKLEIKNVKVYNYDTKKDEIEQLPVFVPLLEKEVALGILHQRTNKTKLVGSEYVNTPEERNQNIIDKVFALKGDKPFTRKELQAGLNEPVFALEWASSWKDKIDDRYVEVENTSSTTGSTTTSQLTLG